MNILILTKKFPYPAKDGETVAILQMLKGLNLSGHHVTVLSINTYKHFSSMENLPKSIKKLAEFHAVDWDTTPKYLSAFCNIFTSDSYHYSRFYSVKFIEVLKQLLKQNQFDIIQLEGLYLTQYLPHIRSYFSGKILLRAHNIEHEIWERTVDSLPFSLKKIYLKWQTKRLKKFELTNIPLCDGIIAISNTDAHKIRLIAPEKPILNLPVGLQISGTVNISESENNYYVAHLGSMDWIPNQLGVLWFLEEVWLKVLLKIPKAQLFLAGRNMPQSILQYQEKNNCKIIGEVENADTFMSDKAVVIVPLLSGSGIRIKIIENMALGKCIVSTTVGAEGIHAQSGENILISDTPEAFADHIVWALQHVESRKKISANAIEFARQHFDLEKLSISLTQFYQKIK